MAKLFIINTASAICCSVLAVHKSANTGKCTNYEKFSYWPCDIGWLVSQHRSDDQGSVLTQSASYQHNQRKKNEQIFNISSCAAH